MKKTKVLVALLAAMAASLCFAFAACDLGSGHHLEKVDGVSATCTEDGSIEYYRCKDEDCGKLFRDAAGLIEIQEKDIPIGKLGHTGGEATCTAKAVCTRCSEEYGELLEHDWDAAWVTTANGHSHQCKNCTATTQEISHTVAAVGVGKDATCTEEGITAGEKCSICGYVISAQQPIPVAGHHTERHAAQAATCEERGNTEYYYCTACRSYFEDEAATRPTTEAQIFTAALNHSYGAWTPNNDGTHSRTCANDNRHVETRSCGGGTATCEERAVCADCGGQYGELSSHTPDQSTLMYTNGAGHYYLCSVCGEPTGNVVAHTLVGEHDENEHWTACNCGYATEKLAHAAASIVAIVTNEELERGQSLTADDIKVTATCECGYRYTVTEVTVAENTLALGNNSVLITYGTNEYTLVFEVTNEPKYVLTLVGATFDGDTTVTASLTEGAALPNVVPTAGKTLLGFKDAELNYYTAASFEMPAEALTISALYKEDMPLFAPSDTAGDNTRIGTHKVYNGIMGTELTFTAQDQQLKARPTKDSGTEKVNVYAPAYERTFMLIAVVNENDTDYEILYQAENWGIKSDDLVVVAKAHSTTIVPFRYGSSASYGSFEGCDHWITMNSEVEGSVALGFYGYLCVEDRMEITSIVANLPETMYADGDHFDLSAMTVEAKLGSSNYTITLVNYTCNVTDGQAWEASIGEVVVSFGGKECVIRLNSLDDWIATSFSKALGDTSWINAEYVSVPGTNLTATAYTFLAGGTNGNDTAVWPNNDYNNPNSQGYNVRIPTYSGKARTIRIYVQNNGDSAISFRLYAENYGDKGGVDISLAAKESKIYTFTVNAPSSIGCNYNFKLLQDVTEDTEVVIYGYFKTHTGEVRALGINSSSSHQRTFTVGETFNAKKLTVDVTEHDGQTGDVNITNFTTDWDGHVFTEEDIGEQTVTVTWNGITTTYTITVGAAS